MVYVCVYICMYSRLLHHLMMIFKTKKAAGFAENLNIVFITKMPVKLKFFSFPFSTLASSRKKLI